MRRKVMPVALVLGATAAVILWIVVFAAGMLIDSSPFRKGLEAAVAARWHVAPAALAPAIDVSAPPPQSAASTDGLDIFESFLAATTVYAPLNAAFLTLLAGFIGGCASKLAYDPIANAGAAPAAAPNAAPVPANSAAPPPAPATSAADRFLTENPFASAARSFGIYLLFMSGAYLIGSSPFAPAVLSGPGSSISAPAPAPGGGSQAAPVAAKPETSNANVSGAPSPTDFSMKFVQFACSISLVAFVIGYDPRKLENLVAVLPGFGSRERAA